MYSQAKVSFLVKVPPGHPNESKIPLEQILHERKMMIHPSNDNLGMPVTLAHIQWRGRFIPWKQPHIAAKLSECRAF